jgi:hypothetical protein
MTIFSRLGTLGTSSRLHHGDRELDRLDKYWRQGFKTVWRLNERTSDHPRTTPKNMTGMGYTTTLDVLSHSLHTYIEHCMKTENVEHQMMRNDRDRSMKFMGKSTRGGDPPWSDLPKQQWELLWQGETMWKKYGALMWESGHKTVVLFAGDGIQK